MRTYRFVVESPGATATEGFSGVEEKECASDAAALAFWLAAVLDEPGLVHRLELGDFVVIAEYTPPCVG